MVQELYTVNKPACLPVWLSLGAAVGVGVVPLPPPPPNTSSMLVSFDCARLIANKLQHSSQLITTEQHRESMQKQENKDKTKLFSVTIFDIQFKKWVLSRDGETNIYAFTYVSL